MSAKLLNLINSGFIKDDFARLCEPVQKVNFLYTGKKPVVGQRTETQFTYHNLWFRMSGVVTYIYPEPSQTELEELEDKSLFAANNEKEEIIKAYGAVHGQRIRGTAKLNFDFKDNEFFTHENEVEIEYIMNDNKSYMWCVNSLKIIK